MLLAVYGTLRKGEALSHYLDPYRKIGNTKITTIKGLKMFVIGAYPGAVLTNDSNDEIVAELINVDLDKKSEENLINILDMVEGVDSGLFYRQMIETPDGQAIIYLTKVEIDGALNIKDWVKDWSNKSDIEKIKILKENNKTDLLELYARYYIRGKYNE